MNADQLCRDVLGTEGFGTAVAIPTRVIVFLEVDRNALIAAGCQITACKADTFGPSREITVGQSYPARQIPTGHAAQALTVTISNGVHRSIEEIDQFKQRVRRQALLRHR